MPNVVLSPHTDDAIFSIGSHLNTLSDVVIASVFAGIPPDPQGHAKHTLLRKEHDAACRVIGAKVVNGDFLDDVYPAPPRVKVQKWIASHCGDTVYVPFGIHHPDHLLVSNLFINILNTSESLRRKVFFYEELPYRVDYPELANIRFQYLENAVGRLRLLEHYTDDTVKREAVNAYHSQNLNGIVTPRVMVRERIWELIR